MLFEAIILTCIKELNEERSASGIYHLLKGKKGIQTVQDAFLFRLENYYRIYPTLTRDDFERKITELERKKLIRRGKESNSFYRLTDQGHVLLKRYKMKCFYGKRFGDAANIFYSRLLLLIQTLTNRNMGNTTFLPIIDDRKIQYWIKQIYPKIKGKEKNWLKGLYQELYNLLQPFSEMEKGIFVHRLTGYKRYGLSIEQLAEKFSQDRHDVILLLESVKHQMYVKVNKEKDLYPHLSFVSKNSIPAAALTESAKTTYRLLQKGYGIEQIASIRKLKINTIHDHIVELAISVPDFPIEPFVSPEEKMEIVQAIKRLNSFKLKDIKNAVPDHIDYFQIRLVLSNQNK